MLSEENRDALARSDAASCGCGADPAVLAERATRGQHRPLLDGDPVAALTACCRSASRCTAPPPTSWSTPTAVDVDDVAPAVLLEAP